MDKVSALFAQDYHSFIFTAFVIMAGIIAVIEIVGKFSMYIGKPVKWVKNRTADHEALLAALQGVEDLKKRQDAIEQESKENDKALREDMAELKQLFIDKDINDMRLAILDFASAITNGREYTREQYSEVLGTYDRYSSVLKKYHRVNGKADISIQIIRDAYKEHLINNDFL